MKSFLTDYMTANKMIGASKARRLTTVWESLLELLVTAIGERPFRPGGRALNAAFYDSFSVALALAIRKNPELGKESIKDAYDALIADDLEFMRLIGSSTSDDENVKARFKIAAGAIRDADPS